MGELKRLRTENRRLARKIERMDAAYERLLEKHRWEGFDQIKERTGLISEVKQWRERYTLIKRLYDKMKDR
jgi:hypothetical protein